MRVAASSVGGVKLVVDGGGEGWEVATG